MSHSPSTSDLRKTDPMGWLFRELFGMFGNPFFDKFRSGHIVDDKDTGIENMKRVWAERIRANRMNFSEIERGLKNCQHCKFGAPGWPEFYELCRPPLNVDEALSEAITQLARRADGEDKWSHPAIYWAASKVGFHDVLNTPAKALRQRFEEALKLVLVEDLPPIPPALVHQRLAAPTASPESIVKARNAIAGMVSTCGNRAAPSGDGLQWARSIVERDKRGDRSISFYQLKAAKEALSQRS